MKTLWYVAKKDLLQTLKDRNSFIFMLVLPLILIAVIGLAFGSFYNSGSQVIAITVAISNQDQDVVGNTVVNALKINNKQLAITLNQYNDPNQVKQQVADGNSAVTGIVIPAGTTARLRAAAAQGKPTQNLVRFYTVPSSNTQSSVIVQSIVTTVVGQLSTSFFAGSSAVAQVESVCHQPGNHCAPGTVDPAAIGRAVGIASTAESAPAQIEALNAGNVPPQINAFDIAVPGYAILFAIFGIQAVAATILQEKEDGTLRRLLIAPVQRYALLGGKLLAQFILTMSQLLVLFAAGYFVFHMHIPSWPTVLIMLVFISFATTGLGILLVSIVRTRRQLPPVVTLVALVSSAIGGAWWPLFIEPPWMQQLAKVGVTAWAMEGLNAVMISGHTLVQVLPDILGLFVYGAVCFLIGMRLFRFQPKTATA